LSHQITSDPDEEKLLYLPDILVCMPIQYCPICGQESDEEIAKKQRIPESLQRFIYCPEHGLAEITVIDVEENNLPDR
jgi:hypothetical protein